MLLPQILMVRFFLSLACYIILHFTVGWFCVNSSLSVWVEIEPYILFLFALFLLYFVLDLITEVVLQFYELKTTVFALCYRANDIQRTLSHFLPI